MFNYPKNIACLGKLMDYNIALITIIYTHVYIVNVILKASINNE